MRWAGGLRGQAEEGEKELSQKQKRIKMDLAGKEGPEPGRAGDPKPSIGRGSRVRSVPIAPSPRPERESGKIDPYWLRGC